MIPSMVPIFPPSRISRDFVPHTLVSRQDRCAPQSKSHSLAASWMETQIQTQMQTQIQTHIQTQIKTQIQTQIHTQIPSHIGVTAIQMCATK